MYDMTMSDKNELLEQVVAECGYTPVNTEEWYLRNLLQAARVHAVHEPVWAEESARRQQVKDAEQQKYEDKIRVEYDLSTTDIKLLVDYGLLSCTRPNDNVKMSLFLVLYSESREARERAILMLPELQREGNINRGVQAPAGCTALQYASYMQDYDLLQLLLQHGARVDVDVDFMSPVALAIFNCGATIKPCMDCVRLLLQHGARLPGPLDISQLLDDVTWTPELLIKFLSFYAEATDRTA